MAVNGGGNTLDQGEVGTEAAEDPDQAPAELKVMVGHAVAGDEQALLVLDAQGDVAHAVGLEPGHVEVEVLGPALDQPLVEEGGDLHRLGFSGQPERPGPAFVEKDRLDAVFPAEPVPAQDPEDHAGEVPGGAAFHEKEAAERSVAEQAEEGFQEPGRGGLAGVEVHAVGLDQDWPVLDQRRDAPELIQDRGDISLQVSARISHDHPGHDFIVAQTPR